LVILIIYVKYDSLEYKRYIINNLPDIDIEYSFLHETIEKIKTRLINDKFNIVTENEKIIFQRYYIKKVTPGNPNAYSRTKCKYEQIVVIKYLKKVTQGDFFVIKSEMYKKYNRYKENLKSLDEKSVYKANLTFLDTFIIIISDFFDEKTKIFLKKEGQSRKEFGNFYFVGIELTSHKAIYNYHDDDFLSRFIDITYNDITANFPKFEYLLFINSTLLGLDKNLHKKVIKNTVKKLLNE
jgi:hypothetical protein